MSQTTPQRDRAARRSDQVRSDPRRPQPPRMQGPQNGLGAHEPLPSSRLGDDVLDAAVLLEIRSLNLRGVLLLQEAARGLAGLDAEARAATPEVGSIGGLVASGLREWLVFDGAARERLASQPFLLFDMGLADPLRWRQLLTRRIAEQPAGTGPAGAPLGPMLAYARVLLHYVWHLARTAPRSAAIVAGMAPDTAALLRGCSVERLDVLASHCAQWLQPRWAADPAFWSELLQAALASDDPGRTRRASLRALQRIGGALARC
jgi:hypothetical protein